MTGQPRKDPAFPDIGSSGRRKISKFRRLRIFKKRLLRFVSRAVTASVRSKYADFFLAGYAFLQALVLPLPVDLLLAPMVLLRRNRVVWYGVISVCGSVAGGIIGYAIGYFAYDQIAPILYSSQQTQEITEKMIAIYRDYGVWAIFIGAISPIPYKLFVVTSGLLQFPFWLFFLVSFLGRALRFGLICALFWYLGPTVRSFIHRKLPAMLMAMAVIIIGVIVLASV